MIKIENLPENPDGALTLENDYIQVVGHTTMRKITSEFTKAKSYFQKKRHRSLH